MDFSFPSINASLNACAAVCLTAGYAFVKAKKILAHRICMMLALLFSAIFLGCYLYYHYQVGAQTPFLGQGAWRVVYFSMLISHIILAVVIVPLIFRTVYLALSGQVGLHRRWARWTYPLWYYVSVTGVLIYFFLYQWFAP
jgi:putative membrane protein